MENCGARVEGTRVLNLFTTLVEFLYQIITKELVCNAFPDDFPSDVTAFVSLMLNSILNLDWLSASQGFLFKTRLI